MKTNIILFDKQDITRLGIEFMISKLYRPDQMYKIFCADTKDSLLHCLISNPDSLVVIDYTLSDLNSVDTLLNISARTYTENWKLTTRRKHQDTLSEQEYSILRIIIYDFLSTGYLGKNN